MSRPGVDASASHSLDRSLPDRSRPDRSLPDREPGTERRLLAARLLESTLIRLGRAGVVIDRRLFPGLSRMHRLRLYTRLGYVRLADYLTERLGMSLRRCQTILRLERALASLPRLAHALESGELSVSRLEVAASAATPETEALWLDRAHRLPLPALRDTASAARAAASTAARAGTDAAPADEAARAAGNEPSPIEQDERGRVISFSAPAPVVATWHWTLDLVRRVAGQQEPAWRCAEFLAAEFLSGTPDTSPDSSRGPSPAGPATADSQSAAADSPQTPADSPTADPAEPAVARPGSSSSIHAAPSIPDDAGMAAWLEAAAAVREALASIGSSADPEAILSERPPIGPARESDASSPPAGSAPNPGPEVHPDDDLDAWALDAHLRRLVRLRQSLAWRQGRLLAAFARLGAHHDLGFETWDARTGSRCPPAGRAISCRSTAVSATCRCWPTPTGGASCRGARPGS